MAVFSSTPLLVINCRCGQTELKLEPVRGEVTKKPEKMKATLEIKISIKATKCSAEGLEDKIEEVS